MDGETDFVRVLSRIRPFSLLGYFFRVTNIQCIPITEKRARNKKDCLSSKTGVASSCMAKMREQIPRETAAQLYYLSDRTCCVCCDRDRPTQIHHIDEDPSNNDIENLAVLCLQCHDQTQIKGGFGRKLDEAHVKLARQEWHVRVKKRRDVADEIAAGRQSLGSVWKQTEKGGAVLMKPAGLVSYMHMLPAIRGEIYKRSRQKWDSGRSGEMRSGNRDVIDVMIQVLIALARFYPEKHFGNSAEIYMNEMVAMRYSWHRAHLEPEGVGTGGSMVSVMVGGKVIGDVERMVCDMVFSLVELGEVDEFDYGSWLREWTTAADVSPEGDVSGSDEVK